MTKQERCIRLIRHLLDQELSARLTALEDALYYRHSDLKYSEEDITDYENDVALVRQAIEWFDTLTKGE